MAVLTTIAADDEAKLLADYGLSSLVPARGIPEGSVNSNFALETTAGRLFLRIYEEQDRAGAEVETRMLERLAAKGVPTPAPVRRVDGGLVSSVRGKPAALFPWRQGTMRCQASVTEHDVARVGAALASVHRAGAAEHRDAGRFRAADLLVRLERVEASGHSEFAPLAGALQVALRKAESARDPGLPRGLVHGDLFRDNVLWDASGDVAALLDFESACEGTYAFDLMVTVLSWCVGDELDGRLARALVGGYASVRALSPAERAGAWAEGSFAALRFTVTRITDYAMREGAHGPRVVKDWRRFMKRFDTLQNLGAGGLRELLGL